MRVSEFISVRHRRRQISTQSRCASTSLVCILYSVIATGADSRGVQGVPTPAL